MATVGTTASTMDSITALAVGTAASAGVGGGAGDGVGDGGIRGGGGVPDGRGGGHHGAGVGAGTTRQEIGQILAQQTTVATRTTIRPITIWATRRMLPMPIPSIRPVRIRKERRTQMPCRRMWRHLGRPF